MEFYTMAITEEAKQELDEIIAMLPDATVEQLDHIGYSTETNHMFAVISKSDPESIEALRKLLLAVNSELKKRGLAIRKQDR